MWYKLFFKLNTRHKIQRVIEVLEVPGSVGLVNSDLLLRFYYTNLRNHLLNHVDEGFPIDDYKF